MGSGQVLPLVRVEERDGAQAVVVRGRVSSTSVPDIRRDLHAAIDTGAGPLLLDLTEYEVGDRTALGLLVEAHRRAHRSGRHLHLVAVNDRTRRMLRGIRFDRRVAVA